MISCLNRNCNALNPPTAEFCMQCGTKLVTQNFVDIFKASSKNFIKNLADIFTASSKDFIEKLGGGVQLEMIAIPGGTFQMGSNEYENEQPIHPVNVKPFYLGKYPITQEQYQAVMGNNPSHFKGAKRPVECVSWNYAVEFCKKLSQKTGKNYRLPSEAEWEYACRAGTQTKYHVGDDENQLGNYAWYADNSKDETHPVGQKKPNEFGLYDMHGNVWEYCSDPWHENYNGAPKDGSSWETGLIDRHAFRGGAWDGFADLCSSGSRSSWNVDRRYYDLGFRVALFSLVSPA